MMFFFSIINGPSTNISNQETTNKIIELLKPNYIDGFSLLGGEPFEPENQYFLLKSSLNQLLFDL